VALSLMFCLMQASFSNAAPAVSVKINEDASRQIQTDTSTPVSVKISLAPQDQNGIPGDWWIAVRAGTSVFSFVCTDACQWQPGLKPTYQGPLTSISKIEVFNQLLPVGDYSFFFGVDLKTDGTPDSTLVLDSVQLQVSPAQPTPVAKVVPCPSSGAIEADIRGFSFVPSTLKIGVNNIIKWTNNDFTTHTVTGGAGGAFDSGSFPVGASVCIQFLKAGTYPFFCSIHPTMTGSVAVQ